MTITPHDLGTGRRSAHEALLVAIFLAVRGRCGRSFDAYEIAEDAWELLCQPVSNKTCLKVFNRWIGRGWIAVVRQGRCGGCGVRSRFARAEAFPKLVLPKPEAIQRSPEGSPLWWLEEIHIELAGRQGE